MVGRLSHRPDSRVATRRLAFREEFPTALALFELRAMATGRGTDIVRDWRELGERARRAREAFEAETGVPVGASGSAAGPRRRRRGRRGGRRRPPTA
jgi:hypothetical protein